MRYAKLSPLAFGLALGILWGLSMLIMGLIAYFFNYGDLFVTSMGTLYLGYNATIMGSIIGGVIGFIDAFIGGLIVAWLYNLFVR
ncbi:MULTISPECIES: bacteriophage holin [Legionella]|uniref:Uncharacterized protein n=1 Tax=Legionella septentrionalis TaxID=2498109 RepID=A0A3S0WQQ5_9GAMM|nr:MULTISPECIES: bacteriophage holin [Legionella]MCP0914371.1 bacteriophage holin [Legionella sp. 27cVA30]RUQ81542.1 hypothetical protein EKM59_10370 [Legionella septentrionalis]RUR00277.1 hypothetical protein ELY11_02720 [Legionella septentrionalis]RUR17553.1 hypothetical protein ELY10_01070 [Legionella septentrionalis]